MSNNNNNLNNNDCNNNYVDSLDRSSYIFRNKNIYSEFALVLMLISYTYSVMFELVK